MNNILIAGDFVPKENNIQFFANENLKEILGEDLLKLWTTSNFKFFNLEAPITDNVEKILKCGPNLKIDKECILGIKKMNPTCIFLANNHVKDFGEKGITDTIKILEKNKINYIGIGKDINNLQKTYSFAINSQKIVIYNCCDHEFSGATDNKMGANEYDILNIFDEIKELKKKNDFVIIVYHGGKEHYRYPSPNLQKFCRKMIDSGADLITCQHTHCICCYEDYKGKKIVYGQGNFIFDGNNNEYWNTSILLNIEVTDQFIVHFIPIIKTEKGTKLASENETKNILNDFEKRSQLIKQKDFIRNEYSKFASKEIDNYLFAFHGNNVFLKILKKIFGKKVIRIFYSKRSIARILDYVKCDAHRELLIQGLKNKVNY